MTDGSGTETLRTSGKSWRGVWPWLTAVLLLGGGFRLTWAETIEYKLDEAWLFHLVAEHGLHGQWAGLGMPSSQRVRVPGMSVWVFYPFAHLFGVAEPTALTLGVQLCNLSALVLLVLFAWRCVPEAEREPWLWAAVLLAVSPVAIIYQRKLWPPCMLPLFCVLFLISWWHRERRGAALASGALGVCLGQIHVSGFLFAGAVLFATLLADGRRLRWRAWLAGSVLGALPTLRWLHYLAWERDPVNRNCFAFHRWVEGKFWGCWVTEPMGLDLRGIVGREHAALLSWPLVGGRPTYAVAVLQGLAALLGTLVLASALHRWWRRERAAAFIPAGTGPTSRPRSNTALIVYAGFVCYGLLLTLAAVRFYRHYMLVTFPLAALWLARLALPQGGGRWRIASGRSLLLGLCVVNTLCSAVTLSYLHAQGGARLGPFGPSYEQQVRETGQRPPWVYVPPEEVQSAPAPSPAVRR